MNAHVKAYKARKRGTLAEDEDRLRRRYDSAVMGKRRPLAWLHPVDLFHATGDPLVQEDPELAARLYGLAGAARPAAALRRLHSEIYGDTLTSLAEMAIWFQERRGWSVLRSAGEAAALAAERGSWIGLRAPVSFERAVELVRKSAGQARALGNLRYQPHGWTGKFLFVVPGAARTVALPAPAPPRSYLSSEGAWVRDDAYWRRRVQCNDVLLESVSTKDHPTVAAGVMAP